MKSLIYVKQIFLIVICVSLISCSNTNVKQIDKESELTAIKSSIHGAIGWAKDKDFNLLYSIIANDTNYLEIDPGEGVIRGFEEFKKGADFWGSPDFKAIRYEIRDLKINLSQGGDVAWYYCNLDDINEWKGKPAEWRNTRWTGVLEKRNGKWIIMQMHFSFAKN